MKTYFVMLLVLFVGVSGCVRSSGSIKRDYESSGMDSHEVDLRLNLVESHINSRQPQFALQELLKVEGAANHLARFHFDAGHIYLQLDEREKALSSFAKAVNIDPDFGEGWNNLGKVSEMQNRMQDAENAYRKALSILTYATPEFPTYNLASLYLKTYRPKEAEEYARKAITRNWRYTPAYKLLADALDAQNRMTDAEEVLRRGLEGDLNNNVLALALAEHQVKAGKNAEARLLFEQIIKQSPRSNEAKVAKDYLGFLQ